MRQTIQLVIIMALAVLGGYMWYKYNPPPPGEYEVIYFGATTDPDSIRWKHEELSKWHKEPASRSVPIRLAELYPGGPGAFEGGFGKYQDIFMQTHGKGQRAVYKRSDAMKWPRFVVLRNGEIYRQMHGKSGWQSVVSIARDNAHRIESAKRKERTQLQAQK